VIKDIEERNVNRAASVDYLQRVWDESFSPLCIPMFSADERNGLSSFLLGRLKEEKEGDDIALVLAVCSVVMSYDVATRSSLVEGGLVALLVEILNSHGDHKDVVERGLWTVVKVVSSGREYVVFAVNRLIGDDDLLFFSCGSERAD